MPSAETSIKRKLVKVILLTSLSVVSVTCLLLLTYEIRRYREATANNLSTVGDVVAVNSTAVLVYDDQKSAQEILSALRVDPRVTAAALYDKQGRLYITFAPGSAQPSVPAAAGRDGIQFHLLRFTLFRPVAQRGVRVGTLYIEGNFGGTYRQLLLYALVLVVVVALSGVAAAILGSYFQRRISEPLLDLARTARQVSKDRNYSVRARKVSSDEIGDLTEAFNAMLGQIQAGHAAQREVEKALTKARDEAVAASRAKDDFLAALSHELRTPLNPVLLLASDAAANPALPPNLRSDFETIRKNVELEARLIDDLLDLTRIARGKVLLERRPVDVNAAVRDALVTVEAEIAAKPIELVLELDPGQPVMSGDATRLQQVFWNVIKNAVKFTPPGGRIRVATRLRPERRRLEVEIADTGIGMTDAEIARVFEAFAQGDHAGASGSHRFGGLGLGLAISRMVVELHAGRISAASDGRDRGATFLIDLPLDRSRAAPAPPAPAGTQPANDPPGAAIRCRILLVEDHAPTRATMEHVLRRRRYEVTSAGSLAEARAAAAAGPVDILISDIGLPDGNGYELMTELRDRHGLVGIALTGFGMPTDVARSDQASFFQHLTKPVGIDLLEKAIAAALASAPRPPRG
ncbi:MAG TPA: ATP-binding protein [Opitutaceae bacterium]|nr:ATP-binding protein [Opitutaceae bacterium]